MEDRSKLQEILGSLFIEDLLASTRQRHEGPTRSIRGILEVIDKPIVYPTDSSSLGAAVELSSPTSYLDVRAVRHNLLRGGNSASGVSSLRSTGGGMNSEAGSGGSGDDGNGNVVGTYVVNVVMMVEVVMVVMDVVDDEWMVMRLSIYPWQL
ncbi:hypothetical protein Tco_0578291 [Tanacetum coccineum]